MPEFVSLGENCLSDDILSAYGLKKESYPFGSTHSNIEYITQIVERDFRDLMNPDYLVKGMLEDKEVLRHTLFKHKNDIFADKVSVGFEFSHLNVLEEKPRLSYQRKLDRLQKILNEKRDVIFVDHNRYSPKNNPKKMVELITNFLDVLEKKYGYRFKFILWYQTISHNGERGLVVSKQGDVLVGAFTTLEPWEGEVHWNASKDRDLFDQFFNHSLTKKYIYGSLRGIWPVVEFTRRIMRKIGYTKGM